MFDPLSLATGVAIFGAGWLARGIRRPGAPTKPVTATCECGHSLAMHEGNGGRCNAQVYRGGSNSNPANYDRCACLHYVGPQPISSMFALPIADEEV